MDRENGDAVLEVLLQNIGNGDRRAFRALYAATSAKLFAVLVRVLRNHTDAEDVLQDVYVIVWNRAELFNPEKGRAMAWLSVIARNAALDAMRRRHCGHVSVDHCDPLVSEEASGFDCMQTQNISSVLKDQLQNLPVRQREAVFQFYMEEKSLAQIANAMDAPVNTVKSWVRRGVTNLRSSLHGRSIRDFI